MENLPIVCTLIVKWIVKGILKPASEILAAHFHEKVIPSLGANFPTKLGAKQSCDFFSNTTIVCISKDVSASINVGGFVADVVQTSFECAGWIKTGKLLGALGNICCGAAGGAAVAGLFGALLGAAISGCVWGIVELVGYIMCGSELNCNY